VREAIGDLLTDALKADTARGKDLRRIDLHEFDGKRAQVETATAVLMALLLLRARGGRGIAAAGQLGGRRRTRVIGGWPVRNEQLLECELKLILRNALGVIRADALVLLFVPLDVGTLQLDELHRFAELRAQCRDLAERGGEHLS
jgi:hypothetical protein